MSGLFLKPTFLKNGKYFNQFFHMKQSTFIEKHKTSKKHSKKHKKTFKNINRVNFVIVSTTGLPFQQNSNFSTSRRHPASRRITTLQQRSIISLISATLSNILSVPKTVLDRVINTAALSGDINSNSSSASSNAPSASSTASRSGSNTTGHRVEA